ncbi:MAG: hypothetical protein PHS41_08165 [Victivallaceae bacterium]|nr:hypothetical protein [Victivallaceae bacterium]
MSIEELIRKAAAGEVLDADGQKLLAEYSPPDPAEVASLRAELESSRAELESMHRRSAITGIAQKHRFTDPEYLGYLLEKNQIDPRDEQHCGDFMTGLEKSSPQLFRSAVASGALAVPPLPGSTGAPSAGGGGRADLLAMLENAPAVPVGR